MEICKDCRHRIVQQEEKALANNEVQIVWTGVETGAWVCPATGNEHFPGRLQDWLTEDALMARLDPDYALILEAAQDTRQAALGDSNDGEIEALQEALGLALSALGIKLPPEYEPYDEE